MTNVEVKVEVDQIHNNGNPMILNPDKNLLNTIDIEEFGVKTFKKELPQEGNPEKSVGDIVTIDSLEPYGIITQKTSLDDCEPPMTNILKSEPGSNDSFEYFDHSSVIQKNLRTEPEIDCNEDPLDATADVEVAIPGSLGRIDARINKDSNSWRLKTHTEQKTIICRCCEETFTIKSEYVTHFRMHIGEIPYQCETCEKTFTSRMNLKVHKFTHTGERPYKCKTCGKCFSSSPVLWVHNKTHMGDKLDILCDTCGKSFIISLKLIAHQKIHSAVKPFVLVLNSI